MLRNKHQEDWNPGSDPSSDPGSNPGSDPGSDPGFIISLSRRNAMLHFRMTFSLPSPSCLLKLHFMSCGTKLTACITH